MQETACSEGGNITNAHDKDPVERLWGLLEEAYAAHDLAFSPCFAVREMVGDDADRARLLELGPGEFSGEGWLWQLESLERHKHDVECVITALKFLRNPTRRTLRAVLENTLSDEGEKRQALDEFDLQMQAREAEASRVPSPQFAEVIRSGGGVDHNIKKAMAALIYEQGWLGMTEIGRRLGQSRSDVYQAVQWFRALPESVRASFALYCREHANKVARLNMAST